MIIDPELRKALRETLRVKQREQRHFNKWHAQKEAAAAFLKANPGVAKRVRVLNKSIDVLEKQQDAMRKEIAAFGLSRDAKTVGDEKKFKANGGILPIEPPMVPGFDGVIAQLTAATTKAQANAILQKLGIHWETLTA